MGMFCIVSGNLGVGKTTLINRLHRAWNWPTLPEAPEQNHYLQGFCREPRRWALHAQLEFLRLRMLGYASLGAVAGPVLADRSLYDDAEVFVPALQAEGLITEDELSTYQFFYAMARVTYFEPDAVIFLEAPIDVIVQRLRQRGFSDAHTPPERLTLIAKHYERWLAQLEVPVLRITTNEHDFTDPDEHEFIAEIEEFLHAIP